MRTPLLALAALLALSSDALAGPPGSHEPMVSVAPPETSTERYGTQVLLADAAWIASAAVLASANQESGAATLVYLGYYAAAPLVHLAHGNRGGAARSVTARLVLPAAGMLAGALLVSSADSGDDDDLGGAFAVMAGAATGALIGVGVAMVVDWTVLAKKRVVRERGGLTYRPDVKASRDTVTVGLAGRF